MINSGERYNFTSRKVCTVGSFEKSYIMPTMGPIIMLKKVLNGLFDYGDKEK